jgi:hypothetical protein
VTNESGAVAEVCYVPESRDEILSNALGNWYISLLSVAQKDHERVAPVEIQARGASKHL